MLAYSVGKAGAVRFVLPFAADHLSIPRCEDDVLTISYRDYLAHVEDSMTAIHGLDH